MADWTSHHRTECPRLAQLQALRLHDAQVVSVLLLGRVFRPERRTVFSPVTSESDTRDVTLEELGWYDADLDQEAALLAALTQKLQLVDGASLRSC